MLVKSPFTLKVGLSIIYYLVSFKLRNNFLFLGILYVLGCLVGLLILTYIWLPPGFTLAGHDSGLPLDAKQFLLTRLYAWDDRLGFGLDNSAYFGSLTIHFFDFLAAFIAGTPYGGNFLSVFFWLGLIFVSAFIFAYQLKDTLGKPFVFILPILLVFNFYIFQSVFMLERAKFGIFSATLISLAMFLRMQDRKLPIVASAIISALAFSIFNGGGWFGITLYGGVAIILMALILTSLIRGLADHNFDELKRTSMFMGLSIIFYFFLNAYSILPYFQNFLGTDAPRLLQESFGEDQKEWLRYVSRSTSFLNLFRLFGVPDWYGGLDAIGKADPSHSYASIYLNNKVLVALSFIFPLLSFGSFILAKTKMQKQILSLFGFITLIEIIFAAGSNSPFGFFYEFLMSNVPGFFLLRSAFYKFGIFYMLGMMVMFSFTVSFLIEAFVDKIRWAATYWIGNIIHFLLLLLVLGLWLSYHFVLFDPGKVFAWKIDQSTKMQVPSYIYDFEKFVEKNHLSEKRVLMVPLVNQDWQNDAYNWGYWSLSPLPYALTSTRILSNWHGLTPQEFGLIESLYGFVKNNDETNFLNLAQRLNVGYALIRQDVLVDSSWSSVEKPEIYRDAIQNFKSLSKIAEFGDWELYQIDPSSPNGVFAVSKINIAPDNLVPFVNSFFGNEHTIDLSTTKKYREIYGINSNKVDVYDCSSCLLEKQARLKSLPEVIVLPNSIFYYFKEREEQRILAETENPKSKIGDYLGLILRRMSELRRMIELSVRQEYLLESMRTIRFYLDQLYADLQTSSEYSHDFEMLQQILDFLNPVERELGDYVKSNAGKATGPRFEDEALGILWTITRIKEFFMPINENIDRWSNEKVYRLQFLESGEYTLFFSLETFPRDVKDDVMLPKLVKFIRGGKEQKLAFTKDKKGWLSAELGFQDKGVAELVIYFDQSPNVFNLEGLKLEKFAFGKAGCYRGTIKNFDKKRAYKVSVSKTDRLRSVRVIFRDDEEIYSERHGFIKGEDSFEVATTLKGEFSRYVYYPSAFIKTLSLYICSEDVSPPLIDEIIVQEFYTPSLISVKKSNVAAPISPKVEYIRINPARYEGEVKDYYDPFVLVFNERINHLWRLSISDDGGGWKTVNKHFMIDGYANGWLVDQNVKKFRIEYQPQPWFYTGAVVSLGTIAISIVWLVYSSARGRRGKNV